MYCQTLKPGVSVPTNMKGKTFLSLLQPLQPHPAKSADGLFQICPKFSYNAQNAFDKQLSTNKLARDDFNAFEDNSPLTACLMSLDRTIPLRA